MTKKLLSMLILCILLLCSCKENNSRTNNDTLQLSYTLGPTGIFQIYSAKDGTYYKSFVNGAIGYYDDKTGEKAVLCSNMGCPHNSDACTAYFDSISYGIFMNPEQDKLFVSCTSNTRTESGDNILYLYSMEPTGQDRKVLYKEMGDDIGRTFAFDNQDNIYFFVYDYEDTSTEQSIEIKLKYNLIKLNCTTKKYETIDTFDEMYKITGAYENYLIFAKSPTSYAAEDGKLVKYNVVDKSSEIIADNLGGYGSSAFVNKNFMYGFERTGERTAKLTKTDLLSGEIKTLSENITYFGVHSDMIDPANFFGDYLVTTSALPPLGDDRPMRDETYVVDLSTGEETFVNLENNFCDYTFICATDNNVVVYATDKETEITMTDPTTGRDAYMSVLMPVHKVISYSDYLASRDCENYLEIS